MPSDSIHQWLQKCCGFNNPVSQCVAINVDPIAFEDTVLTTKWQVDRVFVDQNMRQQPRASAHPHLDGNDGGVGFFHHAFSNGLCWHSVEQSHTNVWSFVLFHLVGSTRLTSLDVIPARIPKPLRLARGVASPVLTMLPVRLRSRIIQRLRSPFTVKEHSTARDGTMSDKRARLGELLEDPDGFLEHCLSETD